MPLAVAPSGAPHVNLAPAVMPPRELLQLYPALAPLFYCFNTFFHTKLTEKPTDNCSEGFHEVSDSDDEGNGGGAGQPCSVAPVAECAAPAPSAPGAGAATSSDQQEQEQQVRQRWLCGMPCGPACVLFMCCKCNGCGATLGH
jgi:hypothetical protein